MWATWSIPLPAGSVRRGSVVTASDVAADARTSASVSQLASMERPFRSDTCSIALATDYQNLTLALPGTAEGARHSLASRDQVMGVEGKGPGEPIRRRRRLARRSRTGSRAAAAAPSTRSRSRSGTRRCCRACCEVPVDKTLAVRRRGSPSCLAAAAGRCQVSSGTTSSASIPAPQKSCSSTARARAAASRARPGRGMDRQSQRLPFLRGRARRPDAPDGLTA